MTRVLIADDHVPLRLGVRTALEQGGCDVCAEAATADDAIKAAMRERPDVCLVDLRMPGDGMRAIAEITANVPETRVVVLTVSSESDDLFDALRSGAVGYLLKDMDPSELPATVEAVRRGEAALPGALVLRLIDEFRRRGGPRTLTSADGRRVTLSSREWDVLELLADGLTTAAIAGRLLLDPVTVRRHISGALSKLGVKTREEAVRLLEESSFP